MADNIMGSLADQSTYDPATGMPYPGNAPDYGDLSQRMTNFEQRLPGHIASGIRDWIAVPGQAYGTVPGGPPTPEQEMDWSRGTALGQLGMARMPGMAGTGAVGAGGAKLVQPEGIFAYHSSPSTFTKFDPSMIGTGEGAQSYGHGFYFAENPAVSGQGGQYWNQFLNRFRGEESIAADMLKYGGFDREQAAAKLQKSIADYQAEVDKGAFWYPNSDKWVPMTEDELIGHRLNLEKRKGALGLLESGNPVGPRTYEVNINARPEQMLNLDTPLYQQGPRVADAFKNITGMELGPPTGLTGAPDASQFIRSMGRMKSPEYVSAALNEAGIPGSRYLDQGSRRLSDAEIASEIARIKADEQTAQRFGQAAAPYALGPTKSAAAIARLEAQIGQPQSSNYVIFDPSKIDIRKMYAVPGAVGAGAAGMGALATQDNYQPQ